MALILLYINKKEIILLYQQVSKYIDKLVYGDDGIDKGY